MNDTPRTDEQINGKPCTRFALLVGDSLRDATVPAEFARQLERENAKLRELGDELRNSAEMIGYVQSADDWRNAERRIKAWDDFLANTAVSQPGQPPANTNNPSANP